MAIIGPASLAEGDRRLWLAEACGRLLVDAGARLVTGGLGGVMAAASRGARSAAAYRDGRIIGLLPGFDPTVANPDVDIAIATGLDMGRNVLVANADAVIAIGGGAGTLSEIAFAWQLRRLIVALRVEGWSGALADRRLDERVRYPAIPDDRIYGADTAEEAVETVLKWLPQYDRRHSAIHPRS